MPVPQVGINECLMKLRIPLSRIRYLTIISTYAPTLTSLDDAKKQFYEQFDKVIRSTSPSNKLVILGDFNARVERDYSIWEGVLGRHGVGKINDNSLLLLSKCVEHSLCITNTLFRMADKYKTTWMHPRSKHWHLIDFIIVRQQDIRDMRVTHAMRGAECSTDHRLVRSVLTLHIAPPHGNRPKTVRAAYNVARLNDPFYRARFQRVLNKKLQDCVTTKGSTEKWTSFKETVSETVKEVLGVKTTTHKDWFDENDEKIKEAIHAKNKSYIEGLNDPSFISKHEKFKGLQAKVQTDLQAMQDQWWGDKAAEVQHYADTHNTKKFFSSLKTVFGPSALGSASLLSSDGKTLIKDQEGLSKRWWIGPHQLTQTPWIRSPNSPYEFPLPSRRLRRWSTRQSPAEHRERMASLVRSTKQRASTPLGPSMMSCSLSWRRRWCQTTSTTPWSSPSTRKREVSQTAGTTGVFPLCESSLTDSSQSPSRPSLRNSASSGLAEAV